MKGGLVGKGRRIDDIYYVHIIMRNGLGQTSDDYHATVTRLSDDAQLIINDLWMWTLKLRLRRRALDRAFKRMEKREKKLAEAYDVFR